MRKNMAWLKINCNGNQGEKMKNMPKVKSRIFHKMLDFGNTQKSKIFGGLKIIDFHDIRDFFLTKLET
jgi:hypothetical protein